VLCISHQGHLIRRTIGTAPVYGVQVLYSNEFPRELGTAGALRHAAPLLGSSFFVLYGDVLPVSANLRHMQTHWLASPTGSVLMGISTNLSLSERSNVLYTHRILDYNKYVCSPEMHHIDAGLSFMHDSALRTLPPDGHPFDLGILYHELALQGQLAAYEIQPPIYEMGSHTGLAALRRAFEQGDLG